MNEFICVCTLKKFKFTMAARFELPNPPHTRPCRIERVHTPTAHLFRKCSNGAFCTSKQHISPRRNDRVRPHTRGGRPHRSGARTWVVYELVLQAERSYAFGLAFLRAAEALYSRRRRPLFRC